ncbi:MAG: outer membrane protein assembly factor BamA [Gammaproteobacteria bacterium]|nr:MAG: outer membrane protein assembly factor BamA [Gammaproteobacteria bacterium]
MRPNRAQALLCACCLLWSFAAWAFTPFVMSDVELVGARRVTLDTVLEYVPLTPGERIDERRARDILKALYATGFFYDVRLARRGDVLRIEVRERPAIAEINVEGNRKLKDEDIERAFEDMDLVEGRIYNEQVLETMQRELERLYYSVGRYGVKITSQVTPLPRNRVKIDIEIKEGVPAKIRWINVVGNERYSDEELTEQFELGIPAWWAFFSNKDEYAKNKLSGDIEKLRAFYLDRGHLDYQLESVQVTISPDRKDIYITLNIHEGDRYTIGDVRVSGRMPLNRERLETVARLVNQTGEYYSDRKITRTKEYIDGLLANVGFAFAETAVQTDVDESKGVVNVTFVVQPGKRTYVRRILFEGNDNTMDHVYRRELRQIEGSWYAKNLIERSKVRLQRLAFVEEVEVDTPRVPGTDDQVDVLYDITEQFSGAFNIGAGYSADFGTQFTASLTHNNILGTGNALSVALNSNEFVKSFNLSFGDPYYSRDGVARTLGFGARRYDTSGTLLTEYVLDTLTANVTYGVPVSEYSRLQIGGGLSSMNIKEQLGIQTREIFDLVDAHGNQFDELELSLGYVYDTRNRILFPDRGTRQTLSVEWMLPGSDLEYAKFRYNAEYYLPFRWKTAFHIDYDIAWGQGFNGLDGLPFYEKYISGGVYRLRGFEARSIGPRATSRTTGQPIPFRYVGGDFMTVGSFEFILPPLGGEGKGGARVALFYDWGNVFARREDFDLNQMRSSFGIGLTWLAPVGLMTFSYAEPLRREPGDEIERFQFSVGGQF